MNRTKVLFSSAIGFPNKDTGGGNRIIHDLITNIDNKKFNIDYCSYNCYWKQFNFIDINKFQKSKVFLFKKVKLYRKIILSPIYQLFYFRKLLYQFEKMVNNLNSYDIIHAHDIISMYFLSAITSKKKILTIHSKGKFVDDYTMSNGSSFLMKNIFSRIEEMEITALEKCDIVIFPSKEAMINYRHNNPSFVKHENKVRIIHNGIDIKISVNASDYKSILANKSHDIKILNIAEHIPIKNVDSAVKAVAVLKKDYGLNPLLLCIGKGTQTTQLKMIIKKERLEKNVQILNFVNNEQIISLMKQFDIYLSTSKLVVFDMVILEALASEMTVVASNRGGNKEIIKHEQNGYLIEPENINEIAEILIKAWKNPSSSHLNEKYSMRNFIEKHQEVYNLNGN
jgi:glycosyltransferase involved in cell wall biosynthesis